MKSVFILAVAITSVLAFSTNKSGSLPKLERADTPTVEPAVNPSIGSVGPFVFDINSGVKNPPQLMKDGGRTSPKGWTPDDPLDLSGEMPSDGKVRSVIVKGVEYLLNKQNKNGSWDVVLSGTLLSGTADEAVDAIAATSLAGISLRYHVSVDPIRLETATKKAADFIIDRVYRGKLPLSVRYANWRYTLGLKFLHLEYLASKDEERKAEIRSVCRRMVLAMMKIQLSNSDAGTIERRSRVRVSRRFEGMDQPTSLGVVLELPTDENYRGGAPVAEVIPGSTADKQGLRVGDKIVSAEGLRVENAVDFYMLEPNWVAGQHVRLKIRRDGRKSIDKDVQLRPSWPGFMGVKVDEVSDGLQITGFYPFSSAKGELEVGDIIYEVNKDTIGSKGDLVSVEATLTTGDKISVKVYRGPKRKKKSERFEIGAAQDGWTGIYPQSEDKGDENGVLVKVDPAPRTLAAEVGIKKGDRVTRIGNLPLLGYDHFVEAYVTIPAFRKLKITWQRNGKEMSGEGIPTPLVRAGDLQLEWVLKSRRDYSSPGQVESVVKDGIADKAGIKAKDVLISVNGRKTRNLSDGIKVLRNISAGEEVALTFKRGKKEYTVTLELEKVNKSANQGNEEGGWAYYPDMKESPSFATAAGMIALMNIKRDLDIKGLYSALKDPLMSAARLINSLRVPDGSTLSDGAECYAYRAGSIHPKKKTVDFRGTQGRNTCCEMALLQHGKMKRGKSHLKKMVEQFIDQRGELDAVRRMEYYSPPRKHGSPHNYDRYNNAAYYWMYGYYHTIQASKIVSKKHFSMMNEICVKALMQTRKDDGTWLGHPAFGPICGTCLALWILGETEGGWKEGDEEVTTQSGKEKGP